MCNLYSHTKGPKAIRDMANAMGGDWLAPLFVSGWNAKNRLGKELCPA
jgi:hypothetical protein